MPSENSAAWASATGLAIPTRIPGIRAGSRFGDVWADMASEFVPTTMVEAFRMCEFLYENFHAYKKGSERVADYFLTSIKASGGDDKKRKAFLEILEKDTSTMMKIREVDINYMAYGNAVVSPHFPFSRSLVCTACRSSETTFGGTPGEITLNAEDCTMNAYCRKCRRTTRHAVKDRRVSRADQIRLSVWNPKRVHIEFNDITGESQYWVSISEHTKSSVRNNSRFHLETVPMPIIQCVAQDKKLKLDPDYVFHMREPSLAGLPSMGWGSPPILGAFRHFFRLQVLMRQDERLMMDYITPMRVVSPRGTTMGSDNTVMNASLSKFASHFQNAVSIHRMSGVDWHVFPFPVESQSIGGEARAASPRDLIEDEESRILNARGVPPELYRASMSLQAAPVALRLFERSWSSLVHGNNRLLQWWADLVSAYMKLGSYDTEMESITVVDDLEDKMWRLQAMQGQLLSKQTAMAPMRIDPDDEVDKILDEQLSEQRKQIEAQERMEMEQMTLGDMVGGPGQEGQPGGGQQDPAQTVSNADEIANELLDPNMPQSERNRRLRAIKQTNEALHAMVMQKMREKRTTARAVGQEVGMQAVLGGEV